MKKYIKDRDYYNLIAFLFILRAYDVIVSSYIKSYIKSPIIEFLSYFIIVGILYGVFNIIMKNTLQKKYPNNKYVKIILLIVFLLFLYLT
ncbi:hypothetical protein [Sporosalibacterium faouarense]|uniref:hypothetical protein n=1 Tax=Sporosalibacterium faouarense TaxID=516123 RepID=UPI00141CEDBB|nr:hypothetical protein [Sporosalibacterium faouarense]MTI47399.1 hypothetical protein [Bacillota bacterium]